MPGKKAGKRYPYLWAVLYGVFLTGYAVFTLLDAFVLPRDMVYVEDITDTPSIDGAAPEYEDPGQDIGEATVPD